MASVKNLKKDINYVLSDIIEECYVWQILQTDDKKSAKAEKIIDETIEIFDALIEKIHAKDVENKKLHFKSISKELEEKANRLLAKIQKLSSFKEGKLNGKSYKYKSGIIHEIRFFDEGKEVSKSILFDKNGLEIKQRK